MKIPDSAEGLGFQIRGYGPSVVHAVGRGEKLTLVANHSPADIDILAEQACVQKVHNCGVINVLSHIFAVLAQ